MHGETMKNHLVFRILFLYLFIFIAGRWKAWRFWCCVEFAACSLSRHAALCLDAVSQMQSLSFHTFALPCFNTLKRHVKGISSPIGGMPELKSA